VLGRGEKGNRVVSARRSYNSAPNTENGPYPRVFQALENGGHDDYVGELIRVTWGIDMVGYLYHSGPGSGIVKSRGL
jgi:hypothetical protein